LGCSPIDTVPGPLFLAMATTPEAARPALEERARQESRLLQDKQSTAE
jgi:hypothetical protein